MLKNRFAPKIVSIKTGFPEDKDGSRPYPLPRSSHSNIVTSISAKNKFKGTVPKPNIKGTVQKTKFKITVPLWWLPSNIFFFTWNLMQLNQIQESNYFLHNFIQYSDLQKFNEKYKLFYQLCSELHNILSGGGLCS